MSDNAYDDENGVPTCERCGEERHWCANDFEKMDEEDDE